MVTATDHTRHTAVTRATNPDPSLAQDYAYCTQLARDHYENFPVASWLLPAAMRPHIAAIYAFARTADDFADEPGLDTDERLCRLDDWRARLRAAGAGTDRGSGLGARGSGLVSGVEPRVPSPEPRSVRGADAVFRALGHTMRECRLPITLFEDLLSAFRQDVTKTRYATWGEVLDYCRRSANPVGRLVLRVAGYHDARLDESSDAFCTALQLTNFWQDLERDWTIGRVYLPEETLSKTGATLADLEARSWTEPWRRAIAEMVTHTRDLFTRGRYVCDGVSGRLRWELRVTWLGGTRILDKIERAEGDVFAHRPTLGKADIPILLRDALFWR